MDVSIPLEIQKDIQCKGVPIGDYLYEKKTDTIYYSLPYPVPVKFAVVKLSKIIATPWMLRLWSFLKYHNIDWLRQQLMQIKCIKSDSVLIHGAAWEKNGKGFLAVGFPNCGKTSMVLRQMQKGAKYCSDENVIINKDGEITPIIRKTSLNPWISKEIDYPLTKAQKLQFAINKIKAKVMPIFEPNIWVDLPYERHKIKLDKIIYLTRGKRKNLAILTDNEFPFYTNPVIQTYTYATGFNLDGVYAKYRSLLNAICFNSK